MNILYITVPSYFDLEISLIRELSKLVELKVLLMVSPRSMKSSAFSIDVLENEARIYKGIEYVGLQQYKHLLNLNNWYIANTPDGSFESGFKLVSSFNHFLKENSFDLIHSTTHVKESIYFLPLILKYKRLLTLHDPIPHQKLNFIMSFKNRGIQYLYKNLLLLSKKHKEEIMKIFHNRINLYFSRLSIYDFLDSYQDNKGILDILPEKYILFTGRIQPYKGVDDLITAYLNSKASYNGIKLVIAGKGKITPFPKTENIVLLNRFIENDELATLIRHCEFLALAYQSATQSGVIWSALALNKPILATNVGDFHTIIKNGINGMLVDGKDIRAFTNGINAMINMDMDTMQDNIKNIYQSGGRESWEYIAKEYADIYRQIIVGQ